MAHGGKESRRRRKRLTRWSSLWVAAAAMCACLKYGLAIGWYGADNHAAVWDELCNRCSSAVIGVLQQHSPNRRLGF